MDISHLQSVYDMLPLKEFVTIYPKLPSGMETVYDIENAVTSGAEWLNSNLNTGTYGQGVEIEGEDGSFGLWPHTFSREYTIGEDDLILREDGSLWKVKTITTSLKGVRITCGCSVAVGNEI
jgi:hypothetical protein